MHIAQAESRLSPVSAVRGVVSAGDELEVKAGLEIMLAGGNAIDAMVAAAFVDFVVEQQNCGLGGYGRLSVFSAKSNTFVTIDHYVRAPLESHPQMFELDDTSSWHYYGHPKTRDWPLSRAICHPRYREQSPGCARPRRCSEISRWPK